MTHLQTQLLDDLQEFAQTQLQPLAQKIDKESYYAKDFMHQYGSRQGFAFHGLQHAGGLGVGITAQAQSIAYIGRICGSTAFNAWCQTTFAWYVQNSANVALQERYLSDVLMGKTLAGTGLSNTMKSLAGIEKHNLKATPNHDGYLINGSLPWVSNIGKDHVFAGTAEIIEGKDTGKFCMFVIEGDQDGLVLTEASRFCALNGTATLSVTATNVKISPVQILATADEFYPYIDRIKSGFVLLQLGMALGSLLASKDIIDESNQYIAQLNSLLDYGADDVQQSIDYINKQLANVEKNIFDPDSFIDVLKLRLYASKEVLKASESACLHAGAFGYSENHHAERLRRESLFVAVITPSMKHLQKAINTLESVEQQVA